MFNLTLTALVSAALALPGTAQAQGSFTDVVAALSQALPEHAAQEKAVSTPLWAKFGWIKAPLNLPDWGGLMKEEGGAEEYDHAFTQATSPYPGIIGKGDVGIYPDPASEYEFDLGDDDWRLVDFIRPSTIATYTLPLNHPGLRRVVGDKTLGDGVIARVRPETIGYTRKLGLRDTYLQVRGFIWREEKRIKLGKVKTKKVCRRVSKGLVHVTDHTRYEYFAPEAAYGTTYVEQPGDVLTIEVMVDVEDYSPQGQMSAQSGYYNGAPGWEKHLKAGFVYRDGGYTDGGKLVMAGCPVYFLPVGEVIRVMSGVTGSAVSVDQGVRRKVAPGLDLAPFTFRAPADQAATFRIGQRYVVHRDPALPDGTSAWSGVCVGYTRGNYFEVPTSASPRCQVWDAQAGKLVPQTDGTWEQGGGDFDGDDALVLPHHTQGGAMLGFNDRDPQEQAELIRASGPLGRKMEGFKKSNYASGLERWMRQRQAAVELGMLDFRAGKLIDQGNRLAAAAIKPLIQVAVDRQKRNLPYPVDIFGLEPLKGMYARQIISAIKKADSAEVEDQTHWHHSWALLRAKVNQCRILLDGGCVVGYDEHGEEVWESLIIQPELQAALTPVAAWVVKTWEAFGRILGEKSETPGFPRANKFPARLIHEWRVQSLQAAREAGVDLTEQEASMRELAGAVRRLRGEHSRVARALEYVVARELAGLGDEAQHEHSLLVTDTSTWVKLASPDDLTRVFSGIEASYARLEDFPGIVVAGRGRTWEASNAAKPQDRVMTNTQPVLLAGQVCRAGTVRLARDGRDIVLSLDGLELTRQEGRFTDGVERLFRAMSRRVMPMMPLDTSALDQVTAPVVHDLPELDLDSPADLSFYEAYTPDEAEHAECVEEMELRHIYTQAQAHSADAAELVTLAIGDELRAYGII